MEKTASTKNTTYTLVAIALMTAVICVLAPLSLPIGPVPISMATLVLFLSIYVLGWKKATISVCLYILLGLVGVPVFSGFTGGVSKLAGATGGYIVGTQDAIERIAYRLTAPGIGLEVGSYAASYQPFYQGVFMAPHTVAQAIKTACLAARVFEILGMTTTPAADEPRADIIQAIQMRTPERLVAFCQGIQMASPIDSMALPEPWDMPGYNDQVVMAAGTFVAGASIELSADAPMREPYTAYMQGGLTYTHGRIALQMALNRMVEQGALTLK